MNPAKNPPRWMDWLLAAATLLLAALLIFQCLNVYLAGTAPENLGPDGVRIHDVYTREDVSLRLSRVAWAFWVWAAALAGAIVCRAVHPPEPAKPRLSTETQLELISSRREVTPDMQKERRVRRVAAWICAGVCALCAAASLLYLLHPQHLVSTDLEAVMAELMAHTLPCLLLGFAALMALAQVRRDSMLREIAAAKKTPSRAAEPAAERSAAWQPRLRAALYMAALALLIAGVLNGGMYDVLVKAVNICTECIGLG